MKIAFIVVDYKIRKITCKVNKKETLMV